MPFLIFAIYGLVLADEEAKADLLLPSVICGGVGGFLLITGFFLGFFSSFPMPMLVKGEQEIIKRHPTMRPAYVRMLISVPFFGLGGYLFFMTALPYVYPFVVAVIGFWLFFKGTTRYLRNLCIRIMHLKFRLLQQFLHRLVRF